MYICRKTLLFIISLVLLRHKLPHRSLFSNTFFFVPRVCWSAQARAAGCFTRQVSFSAEISELAQLCPSCSIHSGKGEQMESEGALEASPSARTMSLLDHAMDPSLTPKAKRGYIFCSPFLGGTPRLQRTRRRGNLKNRS